MCNFFRIVFCLDLMNVTLSGKLKEEEMLSIKKQAELEELEEDRTRQLNAIMDAERQILQWEKKIQLVGNEFGLKF